MRKRLEEEFMRISLREFKNWYDTHPNETAPSTEQVLDVSVQMAIHGYVRGLRDAVGVVKSYSSDYLVEEECGKIAGLLLQIETQVMQKATQ